MKKISFVVVIICTIFWGQAQSGYTLANEVQQKEMIQKITESTAQIKTLRCDFIQKKTVSILSNEMLSEGKMYYKQRDKLRWEYIKPEQYEFVMNGDKVMYLAGTTKNIMNVNSSKVFRRISKFIVSGVFGAGIFDSSTFTTQFFVGANDNRVTLTPKQKELKSFFNKIGICFNKTDYTIISVEIEEVSGDKTFIEMKHKQINKELGDEIFNIK